MPTFETRAPEVTPIDPLSIIPLPGAMRDLFIELRSHEHFKDGKLLADAAVVSGTAENEMPADAWSRIAALYTEQSHKPHFDAVSFWHSHFALPEGAVYVDTASIPAEIPPIDDHIQAMWGKLRKQNPVDRGGLLGLPHPYYAAGQRYYESYGWDTYFTALGLAENDWKAVEGMVANQAYMINRFGHMPNGNRDYLLSRSQPPVFSHMVELLAAHYGNEVLAHYGPTLKREHQFWMAGAANLPQGTKAHAYRRVVRMPNGALLNRYYDDLNEPRQESYLEDMESAEGSLRPEIYRDIRAAAESGWDFSATRWCTDEKLSSMRTTDLIPVDLNAWLAHLERTIADASLIRGEMEDAALFSLRAEQRIEAINFHCWNEAGGIYSDYDFRRGAQTGIETMAMSTPLFTGIATNEQAIAVSQALLDKFLRPGGLATTLVDTNQQWDGNIGWAPLNYKAIAGMQAAADKYEGGHGFMKEVADEASHRWTSTNRSVYEHTGKLLEKYNVLDPRRRVTNGEYEVQEGFGWTNGVYSALTRGVNLRLQAIKEARMSGLYIAL